MRNNLAAVSAGTGSDIHDMVTGADGFFVQMWQAAVVHDDPAACNRGANPGEAQAEQQVSEECFRIQWCERYVFRNHDVGQLARGESATRFAEQAVTNTAVVV